MAALGRLTRRADFLAAAASRQKFVATGLVLQSRHRPPTFEGGSDPRIGFTASRKVGNAVQRNRAKRRLRAVVAQIMPDLAQDGYDYVVIARAATLTCDFQDLLSDLRRGLSYLHQTGQNDRGS